MFGDTVQSSSPPPPKALRNGAFDTVAAAPPETAAAKPSPDLEPTTPVEILYKPRPEYTPEGRKRQIEGEVLLEVLFSAEGKLQVLRVLQGLGHGLDESAVKAARAIRFRPALHRGVPIDSDAIVHITFQLAY
jgi:TonB family protein